SWHNLDLVLETADRLYSSARSCQFSFHILGQAERPSTHPPNVHIHGGVAYQEVPNWLAAMDIGLCLYRPGPADYGSPLKLFDYLSSGLAVIGTPHPQMRQIFRQLDQTDLILSEGSPEELAHILEKLADDRERLRRLREAGRNAVLDQYNWQAAVRAIYQEIEKIC
ncbi:MAG: glycosyltransferase, partial [Anaerolineales bacterium]|nr:glycosyltransferase [Anaerolineales bacterium]